MALVLRRSRRGTAAAAFNFLLTALAGVVVLGNQWVATEVSVAWVVVGMAMLVWAGLIASALLRPVLLVADDTGVRIRRLLGWHRFGWADLIWADLEGPGKVAIIAAQVAGQVRYGGLAKRPLTPEDMARTVAALRSHRPDLPMTNPATLQQAEIA